MPYQRRVRKDGNSYVVALPEAIRAHLGITHGAEVYWHRGGPKEALLGLHSRRLGGKPAPGDAVTRLDAALAEIERLRRRVAERPNAVYREGYSAGYLQGAKLDINMGPLLETLIREVRDFAQRAGVRARPAPRRPARAVSIDRYPSPGPSSSSVPSGGAAASGGAAPQAAHDAATEA